MTIGPVPSTIVSPELSIKKSGKSVWSGKVFENDENLISFSPDENGTLTVAISESDVFKLEDLETKSLTFGRGQAKTKKILISKFTEKDKKSIPTMILDFDLQETNILCNSDQALFLDGVLKDGRKLVTGVKINSSKCDLKNWQKEMSKMLKNGQLDDSIYRK